VSLGWTIVDSPAGQLVVCASDLGLVSLQFLRVQPLEAALAELGARFDVRLEQDDRLFLRRARTQLSAYFDGRRRSFQLALDLRGTPFQRRVWAALLQIPFGQTETYASLSAALGQPDATRAVGRACGRNPLPIIVPCHRVVASDGALTGYLGGVETKRRLLALERGSPDHLPLFAVADRRDDASQRSVDTDAIASKLPSPVLAWLARQGGEDVQAPAWSPEAWLAEALDATGARGAGVLAAWVVDRISPDELWARALTDDLLAIGAAALLDTPPTPSDVRCLLHAALAYDSAWHEVLVHRLMAHPRPASGVLRELERHLESILDGSRRCSPRARERAVDLWTAWRHADGDDSWYAEHSEDPSAIFVRAGLFAEAIVAAEQQLAQGQGDRAVLLGRLADAFEATGQLRQARARLLELVAERRRPEDVSRLRALEDRLRPDDGPD
jgi:methylated-DNA-[protein]-cysteine S-methyltransferase